MKKALAIMICICLLTQCFAQLGVIGYYELNKAFIAKNLCENKDKPQMKCCGKCYLRKQLKKVADDGSPAKSAPGKVDKNEVVVYLLPPLFSILNQCVSFPVEAMRTPVAQHLYAVGIPRTIFHPPSVACI